MFVWVISQQSDWMEIKLTSTDRTDYVLVQVCCCHGDEAVILNVVASVHISLS